jgi:DNA-binding GntR family transcriptional regulator
MTPQDTEGPALVTQTVQEAAAGHLRKLILNGQLVPGQRLLQEELAGRLGISRTPVREALQRLANEGLVDISSYKGATVANLSASEMIEVYSVRIALESYAASLATQRITEADLERLEGLMREMEVAFQNKDFENLLGTHHKLHASIYTIAGKQRLYEHIIQYLDLANFYQRMALSLGRGAKDPIKEHIDILETLRRRDAEAAGHTVRSHLELTMAELLDIFTEQQSKGG